MATLSPTAGIKYPQTGHSGGAGSPPTFHGGDGDRGDGNSPNYGERLRRARLGMTIAFVAITMLFVSFTSAYIVRKGLPSLDKSGTTYVHEWIPVNLPIALLAINTLILLVSSATMELARRQITRQAALAPVKSIPGVSLGHEKQFPWLGITVMLGVGFLVGQREAWEELAARGFYLATSASSSFVYLLTAMHAVHLAGGIVALSYAVITSMGSKPIEARRIIVDVTAWYWHFMALLWIYIFGLITIAR